MVFGAITKQLLKVIEWSDNNKGIISYKFPMTDRAEIMNGSSLTVREGQVAIFCKDGKIADVFAPGRYKLETKNLPVLTTLMSWNKGFNSPFKCDVYFINTTQFSGQKWGTSNAFTMRDPDFGMIRIRGFGSYSFKVEDAKLLMIEMLGSKPNFSTADIQDHLRSIITSNITDIIAESKFSALDLSSKLTEFNAIAKTALQDKFFSPIGLNLTTFVVENISFPENVEKAIDERTNLGILGDKIDVYERQARAQAMKDAANNPGMGGTMFGMGVMGGLAGGVNTGMAGMAAMGSTPAQKGGVGGKKFCSECGAKIEGAKFCPECGAKQ